MFVNLNFFIKITVIWLSCLCIPSFAKNKYNVSLLEMATCKEYDLRNTGYKYSDFFYVHTLNNNKIKNDELLHLKFYVLASMDAHILLSVNDHPRLMDRVYEIVIGAGGNTFSAIRTSMGRRRVATNQDERILSIMDPTPVEVIQKKDGNLLVYIPGFKEDPLLNFTDASPLNINYVSFSTFGTISARWFYDCKFDGFGDEIEQEQRYSSPRDQLIKNITLWSENSSLPLNISAVDFNFQIRAVTYDHETSILNTRLNLVMGYVDKRLEWDPSDFDYIETVVENEINIWKPTLVVLNSAFPKPINYELHVNENGIVLVYARDIELKTLCLNPNQNWPNEIIDCEIDLGLIEFGATTGNIDQLPLEYSQHLPLPQEEDIATYSEWAFEGATLEKFITGNFARFTPKGTLQTMQGDVAIEITISRNRNFYKAVFSMPIFTAHSLIILSFLLRGYRRGALTLVVFAILALGLMFITRHAAPAYVPSVMHAYQINMFISVYCYLLHIAIMWLEMYSPKSRPSACFMSMINSSPLRLMLCMRFADSTEYVDIQAYPWRQIAKMLDSFNFALVLILLVVLNLILVPRF